MSATHPLRVEDATALAQVVARAGAASVVALDTEANGLFVYEARLCVIQLAWREGEEMQVAVVDPLATPVDGLAPLLDAAGPVKLLHDLTFDARILGAAGLRLGRVRDTEVMARLLGRKALGLASLLAAELGLTMKKTLQRHDWSRRPLAPDHLAYLAGDVAHLEALDARLTSHVAALDLAPEVAEETAYKLAQALAAQSVPTEGAGAEGDVRPAWSRVKGSHELGAPGRAVLRHLVEVRDQIARERDVPPFHVLGAVELCAIANTRPRTPPELAARLASRGASEGPGGGKLVARLLGAVAAGLEDGDVPPAELAAAYPPSPPRAIAERRRHAEQAIGAWRRREAARRGWDEQAVLPGHCARDLAGVIVADLQDRARRDAIAAIPGIGTRRPGWFAEAWCELAGVLDAPPSPRP